MNGHPHPAIETVVFDIGGVLLDWNPRHLYRKVFDDEEAMELFLREVCTPEWHDRHDRGESTADSCARLAQVHPQYADEIWAWSTRSEEMVAGPLEDSVAILTDLTDGGIPCYALSNMEAETFPVRFERYAFFALFDGILISGLEGVAKPDRAIFEILLERFGLDAGTTLFIDDNVANLHPASALGMSTVHFESSEALRRSLRAVGLLPGDHDGRGAP
ncbi:MAG TPA: HAD family phosphatase [Acidimicrobiales bacterium]|nr:HAD family phosphatase [Acidimicrobiales bacterium]